MRTQDWPLPRPGERSRPRHLCMTVVVAILVLATVACGDDDDGAMGTTSTTGPDDTATSTTTSRPVGPTEPPDRWVGISEDGRIVVVDRQSGEVSRVLAELDHPEDCPAPGEPAAGCEWAAAVEVSPDGEEVYYETCCEPAPGTIYRVPIDGGDAEMVVHGGFPALDADGDRLAVVELQWVTVHDLGSDDVRRFQDDSPPAALRDMTWSPAGRQLAFVVFDQVDGPGRLHVLDVEDGESLADARPVGPDDGDRSWTLPTFRHDGAVVVVEQELTPPEDPRGPARALVVDPETGDVRDTLERTDAVLSQHHDASGTHLLYVSADGSVRWAAGDGEDVDVLADSGYLAAAW